MKTECKFLVTIFSKTASETDTLGGFQNGKSWLTFRSLLKTICKKELSSSVNTCFEPGTSAIFLMMPRIKRPT